LKRFIFGEKTEDKEKFWVPMEIKDPEKDGAIKAAGEILIQVDVVPIEAAHTNKVGKAREEPNHSPFLPVPEGRLSFSLNPFDMFSQMLSHEIKRKICLWCICLVCFGLCIYLIPIIAGNLLTVSI